MALCMQKIFDNVVDNACMILATVIYTLRDASSSNVRSRNGNFFEDIS